MLLTTWKTTYGVLLKLSLSSQMSWLYSSQQTKHHWRQEGTLISNPPLSKHFELGQLYFSRTPLLSIHFCIKTLHCQVARSSKTFQLWALY
jgi:hypothetical protein